VDETGSLERTGDFRDAGPPGSEHFREIYLRELKLTFSQPIMQHQQPSTATFIEWM
jgi:hypothetical protein